MIMRLLNYNVINALFWAWILVSRGVGLKKYLQPGRHSSYNGFAIEVLCKVQLLHDDSSYLRCLYANSSAQDQHCFFHVVLFPNIIHYPTKATSVRNAILPLYPQDIVEVIPFSDFWPLG